MTLPKAIVLLLFIVCSANQFSFLPKAEKYVSTKLIKAIYATAEERAAKCRQWHASDPGTDHLRLPHCPPTEQKAKRNDAFSEDKSPPQLHHPGADRCYRSPNDLWAPFWRWVRSGDDPGGQQCCYKEGELITDGTGAGTADRGALLWNHWWHDVLPSYFCCMDGNAHLCGLYREKRPTDSGKGYYQQGEEEEEKSDGREGGKRTDQTV